MKKFTLLMAAAFVSIAGSAQIAKKCSEFKSMTLQNKFQQTLPSQYNMKYLTADFDKQQADQKRAIAKYANAGSGNIVPAQVLRAFHQAFQIHRGQISQRQAIHQQSHPTVQQSQAEGISPFGVLQQRESCGP